MFQILSKSFSLSVPPTVKTQYLVHLSFNSTLQLINDILSDLQKLLKYFDCKAIFAFFRIPLAALSGCASVFPNHLALYLKDLN